MIKKVAIVYGTRPEAIKLAPLILKLREDERFETVVVSTGQHKEMLDQIHDSLGFAPDINLNLMRTCEGITDIMGNVISKLDPIFNVHSLDTVIVHGDTATTFGASICAFYNRIKVAHVEAGLRSHNLAQPWPEEANRILTSKISNYHLCPTQLSADNLLSEGVSEDDIFITGNTAVDAINLAVSRLEQDLELSIAIEKEFSGIDFSKRVLLVTSHRRENFGEGLTAICNALKRLAAEFLDVEIVFPVHLNPDVSDLVHSLLKDEADIHLIKPLEYLPFVYLLKNCELILTDSGGLQEEGPSLNKKVFVMRDVTERPEALKTGHISLVGTNEENIFTKVANFLSYETDKEYLLQKNPYGDGFASDRIIEMLAMT